MKASELRGEKLEVLSDGDLIFKLGERLEIVGFNPEKAMVLTNTSTGKHYKVDMGFILDLFYDGFLDFENSSIRASLTSNKQGVRRHYGLTGKNDQSNDGNLAYYKRAAMFKAVDDVEWELSPERSRRPRPPKPKIQRVCEARNTHCWKCKRNDLDSSMSKCNRCGWIICPECGACKDDCVN